MIAMGHNQEEGMQNVRPAMLCSQRLFLCLVWLESCDVLCALSASPVNEEDRKESAEGAEKQPHASNHHTR